MVDVGLDAVTVGHLPEGLGLKEIGEGLGAGIVMEAADTDVLLCGSGVACGQSTFIFRLIQLVGGLGHLKGHQLVVAVALGDGLLVLGLVGLYLIIMFSEMEDRDADLGTDTETGLVDERLIVDGQAVGVAIASEYPGLRVSVGSCHTHLLGSGLNLLVKHLVLRSAGNGSRARHRAGLRQRGFRYILLTVKRITDVVTEIHLRETDSILSTFEIRRPFIDLNLNLQNVIPVAHSGGLGRILPGLYLVSNLVQQHDAVLHRR